MASIEEIREKRYTTILGIWKVFIERGYLDESRFRLSMPLVDEVIEHYIIDWEILKQRYHIPKEIQLHKVAGLMAASILRYRPIVPLMDDEFRDKKEIYANEFFAVLHGLAICGAYSLEVCDKISQEGWFDGWVNNFTYLLHRRNHTPESLAFIFETLCIFNFPDNINSTNNH